MELASMSLLNSAIALAFAEGVPNLGRDPFDDEALRMRGRSRRGRARGPAVVAPPLAPRALRGPWVISLSEANAFGGPWRLGARPCPHNLAPGRVPGG